MPLQACFVHNWETIRIKFFMDILINKKDPVMLIGLAGSGKTLMLNEKLGQMGEVKTKIDYVENVVFSFLGLSYSQCSLQLLLQR